KSLADKCRVTPRHLERYFHKTTGLTVQQLMNRERQMRALLFLLDGKSVKDASRLLGYTGASHFSRDFKRYYGLPPSRLRALVAKTLPGGVAQLELRALARAGQSNPLQGWIQSGKHPLILAIAEALSLRLVQCQDNK